MQRAVLARHSMNAATAHIAQVGSCSRQALYLLAGLPEWAPHHSNASSANHSAACSQACSCAARGKRRSTHLHTRHTGHHLGKTRHGA